MTRLSPSFHPSRTLLLALAGLALPVHAATLTWDITSGDGATKTDGAGTWTTGAGNWNTGAGDTTWNNATPDSAVFGSNNPAGSYAISLGGPITTGGLTFNAGTTYSITGNTLTLSGTPTISVAPATSATISSIIGGTGFVKAGNGTLAIGGASANTYTGGITVSAGTLSVTGSVGDGSVRGNVTIQSGGTVHFTTGDRVINTALFDVQSGGVLNRATADTIGSVQGAGTIMGNGTLTLDMISGATQTFSGSMTGGPLTLRGNNNSGAVNSRLILTGNSSIASSNINVQRGASATGTTTLEFGGAGVTSGSTLAVGIAGSGQARVELTGTHNLTLAAASIGDQNNHPGWFTQSGGTATVSGLFRVGHYPGSGTYSISSGTLTLSGTPGGVVNQAAAAEQNGVLYAGVDGTGTILQSGGTITANALVLDARGNSTGTDTYTMTGGTLRLAGNGIRSGSLDANTSYAINLGAGTVEATATWSSPLLMTLTDSATRTTFNTGANTITLSGALSGLGGLNKTGTGTLILSGANTYAGNTVINASSGTVQIGGGGTVGAVGGDISLGASSTLRLYRSDTWTLPNNISGAGTLFIGNTTAAVETDYVDLTGNNSGFTGPVNINMGGLQINDSNGLGSGTKTVTITNGTAGNPFLRLNGAGGDITLPSSISFLASVQSNQGALVNVAGNNTVNGAVTMTTGGGDTVLNSLGGSLTMAGDLTFNASNRNLQLKGNASGTVNGVIANGGQPGVGVAKSGTGTWTLANAANTYNGTTQVTGGLLVVSSGNEGSLGLNPGSYTAGQLTLNGGGLGITGSSLTINDTNRGITIGASGGTFNAGTGLTLTVANNINGSSGQLNKAGAGTFNLTAGTHALGSFNVVSGTFTQSGGTVNTPSGTISGGATYRLAGGKLRLDALTISGGFDWTGGTLTHYTTGTSIAMAADNSSAGFQEVGVGRTATVTGDLSSGAGAVLALHGSPTLYESLGIRFNNFHVIGALALAGVGDVLEMEFNPYLLRPFSTTGTDAIEYGSLPLLTWTGSYDGNTFDTVTGIVNDGRGFALSTFSVVDGSALDINTYFLEYDAAAKTLWFHYKVNGYVPEPDTFALLALSVIGLRTARTLRERRARLA